MYQLCQSNVHIESECIVSFWSIELNSHSWCLDLNNKVIFPLWQFSYSISNFLVDNVDNFLLVGHL